MFYTNKSTVNVRLFIRNNVDRYELGLFGVHCTT